MVAAGRLARLLLAAALSYSASGIRVRPRGQRALKDAAASTVVGQHGPLTVKGNHIVGKNGKPVRLRGMSLFWSQWMGKYWNAGTINWLVKDWGCNLVRAAMGVDEAGTGYLKDPKQKALVTTVVDAAIKAGIYVIIDWHDHNANQHVAQSKAFFEEMARKYGKKPNVIFETFNEPKDQDWAKVIKPYHEQIVPVIRRHSQNLIILGTRTFSQEVDVAAKNKVKGQNLAYTLHFYAGSHKDELRAKATAALKGGIVFFVTEWGTCNADGNGALNLAETAKWLKFLEQHHISDANWAVSDKPEACSALKPNAKETGGWPESQLTPSGAFVRKSIKGGAGHGKGGAGGAGGALANLGHKAAGFFHHLR